MRAAAFLLVLLVPSIASAQAWTRDRGDAYLNLTLSFLSGEKVFGPDFAKSDIASRYGQLSIGTYGEIGLIDRWLTLSFSGELYRRNQLADQGATAGLGDFRIGAWSGVVVAPLRITLGAAIGLPFGDDAPSAGAGADEEAQLIARSLPTGDGEIDIEPRVLLGYAFGGGDWPLEHWTVAELGYALRTKGFADAVTYKLELGTRGRGEVLNRFHLAVRFFGTESLAGDVEAASGFAGLGNGVTFTSLGLELGVAIAGGVSASVAADTAVRARSIIAAIPLRFTLAYEL